MSNPAETRIDTDNELTELSDGEYVWSDDDGQLLDVVIALPAMSLSEPRNFEETPRDEAVVAAEVLVAASKGKAEVAGGSSGEVSEWKKFLKPKGVNTDLALSTGASVSGVENVNAFNKKGGSQLINMPEGPTCCNICGKEFASWKAVFGHLKTHKDRGYVGFLPPPSFNAAEERSGAVGVAASSGGTVASGSGTGRLGIDLNVDLPEEEDLAAPGSAPRFDLNKSPPHDEDEEQEGNAE